MNKQKKMLIILAPCLVFLTSIFLSNISTEDKQASSASSSLEEETYEESKIYIRDAATLSLGRSMYKPTETELIDILMASVNETEISTTTTEEPTTPTTVPEPVYTTLWCSSSLNLRESDCINAPILYTARKGTEVIAINYDINNEWTEVKLNDINGYMKTDYLSAEYVPRYTYYYIVEGGKREELDRELQEYGQDLICSLGMEEYIPYWYLQCYQESRFRMTQSARAHGGYYDWGIMQIWEGLEHDKWSGIYQIIQEHPNYKTDPYDNITCGIYQFYRWYCDYNGDMMSALGTYLTGNYGQPSQTYINDVLSHKGNLYSE